MDELTTTKHKTITISINGTDFETTDKTLTGSQIKVLGNVPTAEALFLKHGHHDEQRIEDSEEVKLKNGDEFESSPDGAVS